MLPDFPTEKGVVRKRLDRLLEHEIQQRTGRFAGRRYTHHEGDKWEIIREDGSHDLIHYRESSAGFELSDADVQNMSKEELHRKILAVAGEMADQQERELFSTLLGKSDKRNQGSAGPFTVDTFLEALDQIQIDFVDDNTPILPIVVIHPVISEGLREQIPIWNADPAIKKRVDEIIALKRLDWRDREANRRLVD